jgi:hypothetical protein
MSKERAQARDADVIHGPTITTFTVIFGRIVKITLLVHSVLFKLFARMLTYH